MSAAHASTNSSVSSACVEIVDADRDGREGEERPEDPSGQSAGSVPAVLDAVLFDWGDTLMQLGARARPARGRARGRFRRARPRARRRRHRALPRRLPRRASSSPASSRRSSTRRRCGRLLGEFDIDVDDDELGRFLEAEHAAWAPACQLASTTHALLESLRERGLKLGLVSNAFDPPDLLHRDLAELGVAERLDVALFSSEVGQAQARSADLRAGARAARGRAGADAVRRRHARNGHRRRRRARHAHLPRALVPRGRGHARPGAGLRGVHADGRAHGRRTPRRVSRRLRLRKHQTDGLSRLAGAARIASTMWVDE